MSKFEDLLNRKLPSQEKAILEGVDCYDGNCDPTEACQASESIDDDIEADLDSIDLDNLSDEDIDDISEDDLAAVDDDDDEMELSDDEAVEADATMALVATPAMLDKELTESTDMEDFFMDFPTMVTEGFLVESDLDQYLDSGANDLMTEARVFAAKTRVQLDEKDRRKQLFEIGVQASARAHNDPIYWKLQKCYKLERIYKAKLRQKYRGEALKRVKAYVKKLKASSSKILSKIGDKLTGK